MTFRMVLGGLALAASLVLACGGSQKPPVEEPTDDGEDARVEPAEENDGLEVEGLLGTLDPADVQPVIQKHARAIEKCYTGNTGEARFVGGTVELKLRVNLDGTVKTVRAVGGDLGSWPVERCLLEVARTFQLPRPDGGEAEIGFPLEFPGRGMVTPLDGEQAEGELRPVLEALRECGAPGEAVPVRVTVYVGPAGAVKAAGFASEGAQPVPAEWAECAHARALATRLSDPRGTVWKIQGYYPES